MNLAAIQPNKSTIVRSFHIPSLVGTAARLAPRLAVRVLARQFLTPWKRRQGLSLLGARRCIEVPVGTNVVRVGIWGSGPLVVLVHGWSGSGEQLASMRDALLFAGFSVAAFDAPAHGATPGKTTNAAEFASILHRLAEHHPLHGVVAHSLGGLAAAVACARGLAVNGLVLVAPLPSLSFALDEFQRALTLPSGVRDAVGERVEYLAGVRGSDWSLDAALPRDVPSLLVHDVEDQRIDVAHSRRLGFARPTLRQLETNGLGHSRILQDAYVLDQIVSFLRGLQVATTAFAASTF